MEIADIKTFLNINEVLSHYGMTPDRNGQINCPFHADKTPSMQVYEKTNTVYCFSSNCRTHGHSLDVIDFIMHREQVTKHEALKKAAQMANPEGLMTKTELLARLYNYFKNGLRSSPGAKAYCESRKLDPERIEIGFNGGQYHHGSRKEERLINACVRYGLLSEHKNPSRTGEVMYQVFGKNSLVFGLRDAKNQVVSLYFRSIQAGNRTGKHYYLRDRSGLYPAYPSQYTQKLILTESVIDAGSLLQNTDTAQKYSILALYGTNGLTEEHQKAIKSIKQLEEIILFFDGDQAGREAVKKYAPMLREMLTQVKITVCECPEGEDINSLLVSHEGDVLTHLLETRQDFLFSNENTIENKNEKENSIENKKASENQTPELQLIENQNIENQLLPILESSNPQILNTSNPQILESSNPQILESANPHNLIYRSGSITYHIKGGIKGGLDSLKISVQIINETEKTDYRGKLDLYEHKQVSASAHSAAEKLRLNHSVIESDLSRLTGLLEDYRERGLPSENPETPKHQVSESNTRAGMNFLQQEQLLARFNTLLGESGIVGEENNRLLLFVVATSYAMPHPLHALIQGSSGSGKTHLLLKIAELMPSEDTLTLTRVTENSFYNYGENDLKHKLLCMEDLDGLKEEAFLAFRELQSRGMLTSSTSIKDETGNIKGVVKTVRGPVATLSATTKGEIYEDNMSRCFLVAVDETAEQTRRIIGYQNQQSAGLIERGKQEQIKLFIQNCIRLLRPREVVNPYAGRLSLPPEAHKIRRLNELYQVFVRQITLINQYQRQKDEKGRLLSTKADLQTACQILFESIVLKIDELDGSLRLFYERLKTLIQAKGKEYEFTRREVRQALQVSKTQQHGYFMRLEELEYIKQSGGYINRGLHYKISHWDSYTALRAKIKDHLEGQLQQIE